MRDANFPAIFIPRGFGEWQFVIPRGSGKLKPIPRVLGSGEFWGVFYFRFEVNLKFLLIEKIFLEFQKTEENCQSSPFSGELTE